MDTDFTPLNSSAWASLSRPKNYRLYFNRKNECPQVWSIDEGDQSSEVNVQWFSLLGCTAASIYNHGVANEDTPVAWIAVKGTAEFRDGGVVIR